MVTSVDTMSLTSSVASLACSICLGYIAFGLLIFLPYLLSGDRGSSVVKVLATNWKVAGSIPASVIFH